MQHELYNNTTIPTCCRMQMQNPFLKFNFKADASVFCIVIQINIKGTQIKYSTSGFTDTDTKMFVLQILIRGMKQIDHLLLLILYSNLPDHQYYLNQGHLRSFLREDQSQDRTLNWLEFTILFQTQTRKKNSKIYDLRE